MRALTPVRASGSSMCTGVAAWAVRAAVVEPVHAVEVERDAASSGPTLASAPRTSFGDRAPARPARRRSAGGRRCPSAAPRRGCGPCVLDLGRERRRGPSLRTSSKLLVQWRRSFFYCSIVSTNIAGLRRGATGKRLSSIWVMWAGRSFRIKERVALGGGEAAQVARLVDVGAEAR